MQRKVEAAPALERPRPTIYELFGGVQRKAAGAEPGAAIEPPLESDPGHEDSAAIHASALRGIATSVSPLPHVGTMLPANSSDGSAHSDTVRQAAERGVAGAHSPLPHAQTIQALFGRHDISQVRAEIGGAGGTAAKQIGARAYATGDQVAFAEAPDLHTTAHEAAHVVQQRAGVSLKGDVGQAGDAYEQHADHVADLVVAGQSAESALDQMASRGTSGGQRHETTCTIQQRQQRSGNAVQRDEDAGASDAVAPEQNQSVAPEQNQSVAPKQKSVAPEQNQSVAPKQNQSVAPKQNQSVAPEQNQSVAPEQNQSVAPEQNAGGAQQGPGGAGGAQQGPGGAPQGQSAPGLQQGAPQGQGGAPQNGQGGQALVPGAAMSQSADEILEKRADPAVAAKWTDTLTRIDTFRIQSAQWSYNPTSLWHNIWQQFLPTDSIVDHWRVAFTNNPYGAGTSDEDVLQARIEGLRGVMRLLGDVAGAVSNWTGALSGISAALALATSETIVGGLGFGAISVILGQISTWAAVIKVIIDVVELALGFWQMWKLKQRIKNCKDPAERLRLLSLMKKESADFTNGIVTTVADGVAAVIAAATMGIGSGAGSAAGDGLKAAAKEAATEAGKEIPKLVSVNAAKMGALDVKTAFNVAKLALTVGRKASSQEEKLIARLAIDAALINGGRILEKGAPSTVIDLNKGAMLKTAIVSGVNSVTVPSIGASVGIGKASAAKQDPSPSPAGASGQAGTPADITTTHVAAWPSLLTKVNDMRPRIQNASIRMHRQYELAKGEVSSDIAAKVDAAAAKMQKARATLKQTAGAEKSKAEQDAATAKEQQQQSKDARAKEAEAKAKAADANQKNQAAANKAGEEAQKPSGVMAWIGRGLLSIQRGLLQWMLKDSDITPDEAAAAGLESNVLKGHENDKKATAEADDAESKADDLDKAAAEAKKGQDKDQQYAIQSMADALHWISNLDGVDQDLAEYATASAAYIAAARTQIEHELAIKNGQNESKIDAEYVAPIIDGATQFQQSIQGRPAALRTQGSQATQEAFAAMAAQLKVDFTQPIGVCKAVVDGDAGAYDKLVGEATQLVSKIRDDARALIGDTNYDGAAVLAGQLENVINKYNELDAQIKAHTQDSLNKVVNDSVESLRAAAQPGAGDGAPGANPGSGALANSANGDASVNGANSGGPAPSANGANSGASANGTPVAGAPNNGAPVPSANGTPVLGTPNNGAPAPSANTSTPGMLPNGSVGP